MWSKAGLFFAAVGIASLAGCSSVPDAVNPISWYRDLTGISKNDNLGNGENQQNLNAGSDEPYPNLATVPPAPSNALSGVDRDKLIDSLIADRSHALYGNQDLHAGEGPKPLPPQTSEAESPGAAAAATPAAAAQNQAPPAGSGPTPAAAAAAPQAGPPAAAASAQRKPPARGSEAPPAETPLQSPTVRSLPQGEAVTPAPPPPVIPPPNAEATASRPAPQQTAAAPADAAHAVRLRRPPAARRIANVRFADGSADLPPDMRATIAEIIKRHEAEGGTIRVVGHGGATGTDAGMAALTLALDRAQAVATALMNDGVPAKAIAVDAAPVAARGGADAPRAEIFLVH